MGYIRKLISEDVKVLAKDCGIDYIKIISKTSLQIENAKSLTGLKTLVVVGKAVPQEYFGDGTKNVMDTRFFSSIMKVLEKIESSGALAAYANPQIMDELQIDTKITSIIDLKRIGKTDIFISSKLGIPLQIAFIFTDLDLEYDAENEWKDYPGYCELCQKEGLLDDNNLMDQSSQKFLEKCKWIEVYKENLEKNKGSLEGREEENKTIGNITGNITVATLGPMGTCSENASFHYLKLHNRKGDIKLYSSFEEAAEAVINEKADYLIVPSAYRKLADIIFLQRLNLKIVDVFKMETPGLVIADMGKETKIEKVASHPTPLGIVKEYFHDTVEYVISKSNSDSALLLINGKVDACITTVNCVNIHNLNVLYDFGAISMGWNVFKRTKNEG